MSAEIKDSLDQHSPAPEDTSAQQQAQAHIRRKWERDDINSDSDSKVEQAIASTLSGAANGLGASPGAADKVLNRLNFLGRPGIA